MHLLILKNLFIPSGAWMFLILIHILDTHFFYQQPHFRVEPRVAIKIPKMRLKVAMKLPSIFGIEAHGC